MAMVELFSVVDDLRISVVDSLSCYAVLFVSYSISMCVLVLICSFICIGVYSSFCISWILLIPLVRWFVGVLTMEVPFYLSLTSFVVDRRLCFEMYYFRVVFVS